MRLLITPKLLLAATRRTGKKRAEFRRRSGGCTCTASKMQSPVGVHHWFEINLQEIQPLPILKYFWKQHKISIAVLINHFIPYNIDKKGKAWARQGGVYCTVISPSTTRAVCSCCNVPLARARLCA